MAWPFGLSFWPIIAVLDFGLEPDDAPGRDVPLTAARWQAPTPREERRVGALGVLPLTRTVGASTDREPVRDASRICAAPLRAHGASTQQPPRGSPHLAHARR